MKVSHLIVGAYLLNKTLAQTSATDNSEHTTDLNKQIELGMYTLLACVAVAGICVACFLLGCCGKGGIIDCSEIKQAIKGRIRGREHREWERLELENRQALEVLDRLEEEVWV